MTAPTPWSEAELRFLTSPAHPLGRVATVGRDGTPHVVPSGWTFNAALGCVDVTGREVQTTKKFRDVARTGKAAIVIDGVATGDGWNPWAIEIAGRADALTGPPALIRIYPERVRSWGLDQIALAYGRSRISAPRATTSSPTRPPAATATEGGRRR